MEQAGNAASGRLHHCWRRFRSQLYERKVRYNEQFDACLKNFPARDYHSPAKVGVALGWKQWSYMTFAQRDEMCGALPIGDLDALVRVIGTWKDSPACVWHAKVQIGEPRIHQFPMARVPVWAAPGGGDLIDVWGRTAVANTQEVAARRFAELLVAWPASPERERYRELMQG